MSRRSLPLTALLALSLCAVSACSGGRAGSSTTPSASASASPTGPKTVAASYVAVVDHDGDVTLPVGDVPYAAAFLIGPHFMLQLKSAGVLDEIDADLAETIGLAGAERPAAGHEFVVARFDSRSSFEPRDLPHGAKIPGGTAGDTSRTSQDVVVDGKATPLKTQASDGSLVIASVPVGHHAYLRVADGGRRQSLDLRTGKRVRDSLTPYYPTADVRHGKIADHWDGVAYPAAVRVRMEEVGGTLSPFAPSAAWARNGKAWLYVRVRAMSVCSRPVVTCRVRLARGDFTVVLPGGRTARAEVGRSMTTQAWGDPGESGTGTYGFEVPAKTRSATLVVRFAGRVTLLKGAKGEHLSMGSAPGPARVRLRVR